MLFNKALYNEIVVSKSRAQHVEMILKCQIKQHDIKCIMYKTFHCLKRVHNLHLTFYKWSGHCDAFLKVPTSIIFFILLLLSPQLSSKLDTITVSPFSRILFSSHQPRIILPPQEITRFCRSENTVVTLVLSG